MGWVREGGYVRVHCDSAFAYQIDRRQEAVYGMGEGRVEAGDVRVQRTR